eukprot:CAMPEP_0197260278 /NCGR_PEP_ID=MMETSP1429-20130617/83954_1 /TAXON_ID=49237 /ORGANISM="Chaetoceros  sp., Strain UNC1202" /LENGTH=184 /DNA_ID=CAMNT_0042724515 /DNA_START=56 /DNA_END=610 /DNA_ORIENTATION=+
MGSSPFALFVMLFVLGQCIATDDTILVDSTDAKIYVSPDCAAVLLAAGGTCVLSWAFIDVLLYLLGFTEVGPEAGSFAAWWQSKFPLVEAGSLFSLLQSIAMGGTGKEVLIVSALGGAAAALELQKACAKVDEVDSHSFEGGMIRKVRKSIGEAGHEWKSAAMVADHSLVLLFISALAFSFIMQ